MRRLKHQNDVERNLQTLRPMATRLVELDNQNTVCKVLSNQVEKRLKAVGVEVGELVEEVFSSRRERGNKYLERTLLIPTVKTESASIAFKDLS